MVRAVEELDVFKLAHSLVLEVFELTKKFPESERYGLTAQMRRAAYSIPMNLMEGAYRLNTAEYRQFAGIAKGSAGEIRYQLLLVRDLGYITLEQFDHFSDAYERVIQMLVKLVQSLT